MSKYEPIWNYVRKNNQESFVLSFDEIEKIASVAIDHSFLNYKKELL